LKKKQRKEKPGVTRRAGWHGKTRLQPVDLFFLLK
jgi:hypothetical protein